MTINRLNYEIYLVDYLDGNLNAIQVDELLLFLDQNPDIKEAFYGMEDAVLVAESTTFPNKSSLKKKSFLKDGIENEFEYQCIAAIEGLLSNDEKKTFEKDLRNDSSKQKIYQDYQKAKVNAEPSIVFTNKSHLKRTTIIPIRYSHLRLTINIAATITLLLGVYTIGRLMIKETPNENTIIVAETINTKTQTESTIEIKKPVAVFERPKAKVVQTQVLLDLNNNDNIQEDHPLINREEYIPNPIKRRKVQQFKTQIDPQSESLAQILRNLNPERQIINENLLAQQDKLSTFEAIQNGVKFISKLVGRDIKLDANKDKNGNIEKISFESKFIAFSTQVKNE